MTEHESTIALDRMVADNKGNPIQAYFGEKTPVCDGAYQQSSQTRERKKRYWRKRHARLAAAKYVTCSTCSESEPQ